MNAPYPSGFKGGGRWGEIVWLGDFSGFSREGSRKVVRASFSGVFGDCWRLRISGRSAGNPVFIGFARKKGYLPRHVDTEVKYSREYKPGKPVIGIYTPEQLKILLFNITPRLVPFVAIGGLSGMRSAEIVRMQWGDIFTLFLQVFTDLHQVIFSVSFSEPNARHNALF